MNVTTPALKKHHNQKHKPYETGLYTGWNFDSQKKVTSSKQKLLLGWNLFSCG